MAETGSPVVVTGLGVISPIGIGRAAFWSALCAGKSGIAPWATADATVPRLAARLPEFASRDIIRSSHLRRADTLSRSIVCAARLALTDAGLPDVPPERMGIVVGSALGDVGESAQYLARLFTKGPSLVSPMTFPNLVLNAAASYAAMELGCTGANLTVSQGEVSGEQAIALGCDLIRAGRADLVLAGGGDQFTEIVVAAYRDYRALSSQRGGAEWCSPYDVDRNGIILGEGAAMLVLESAEHAHRRAATVYAELLDYVSFGVPAPAYDWPLRAPAAAARLRELVVRCLGSPTDTGVDLVCGSANSSRRLDACEVDVLLRVFGEAATRVALTSIKGAIGQFGAAGALAAAATCLALRDAIVPPLCNLRRAPANAPFRFAAPRAEPRPMQTGLMLSMARGGGSMALLFRRPSA